eukprot:948324-Pelagomonas_calceolata.AAC.2
MDQLLLPAPRKVAKVDLNYDKAAKQVCVGGGGEQCGVPAAAAAAAASTAQSFQRRYVDYNEAATGNIVCVCAETAAPDKNLACVQIRVRMMIGMQSDRQSYNGLLLPRFMKIAAQIIVTHTHACARVQISLGAPCFIPEEIFRVLASQVDVRALKEMLGINIKSLWAKGQQQQQQQQQQEQEQHQEQPKDSDFTFQEVRACPALQWTREQSWHPRGQCENKH